MDDNVEGPLLYRLIKQGRYGDAMECVQTMNPHDHYLYEESCIKTVLWWLIDLLLDSESFDEKLIPIIKAVVARHPEFVFRQSIGIGWDDVDSPLEKPFREPEGTLSNEIMSVVIDMIGAVHRYAVGWSLANQGDVCPVFNLNYVLHKACYANTDIAFFRSILNLDALSVFKSFVQLKDIEVVDDQGQEFHNFVYYMESPTDLLWKSTTESPSVMEKMSLLVLSRCFQAPPNRLSSRRLLHAVCAEQCPRDFVTKIIDDDPPLLVERDANGNVPLHCAVRNAFKARSANRAHRSSIDKSIVMDELKSQAYQDFVVEQMLQACPLAAAQRNNDGQLPLHVALSGSYWSFFKGQAIRKLVKAYPDALLALDGKEQLYPMLVSSLHSTESASRVSITYELFRAAPAACFQVLDNE